VRRSSPLPPNPPSQFGSMGRTSADIRLRTSNGISNVVATDTHAVATAFRAVASWGGRARGCRKHGDPTPVVGTGAGSGASGGQPTSASAGTSAWAFGVPRPVAGSQPGVAANPATVTSPW
jgi:hypothetical protein